MSCVIAKLAGRLLYTSFLIRIGVTDEIFGVSAHIDGKLNPYYTYGLISVALPGGH